MKELNVMKECIKAKQDSVNGKRARAWAFGRYKNAAFVTNGYVGYFINENRFYLDPEKIGGDPAHWFHVKTLVEVDNHPITFTTRMVQCDGKRLCVFDDGGTDIYVDEKLLKNFDLPVCQFKGNGALSPVLIYERETLVGIAVPTKYRKGV